MLSSFILFFIVVAVILFLNTAIFGASPKAANDLKIKNSPNFRNGAFQNQSFTPMKNPDTSYWKMFGKFINKDKNTVPQHILPTEKINLKDFNPAEATIAWFGHSSYLLFIEGKKILVDPVFHVASPVPFFGKPFAYSQPYTADDFPPLDFILLTHDHYDHLDYLTLKKLIPQTKHFVCPLGVDHHLIKWGALINDISVLDWNNATEIDGFKFTSTPARHFSGRKFKRGNTLWSSFILKTATLNLFLGGDSGYDKHFAAIGEKYGPFDLAILECGQYNEDWHHIHMFPEETLLAAEQLKAKRLLPVHWGKFDLSLHPWTEPIERLMTASSNSHIKILTPQIGAPYLFLENTPTHNWWKTDVRPN